MANFARYDMTVERNDEVSEVIVRVRGLDLTSQSLAMEVRLAEDTPGAPLIELGKTDQAQGLFIASVTVVNGVPQTDLRVRIDKAIRQGLPYSGELGDPARLAYALVIGGITRLRGAFVILASAYDSDNAPSSRPASYGGTQTSAGSSGVLIAIDQTDGVVLVVDGAEVLASYADDAAGSAAEARADADRIVGNASQIIPLCEIAVERNSTGETQYIVTNPAGFDITKQGKLFRALIPATNLNASPTLNIRDREIRPVFFQVAEELRVGWEALFRSTPGAFTLVAQFPNALSFTPTETKAQAAYDLIAAAYDTQIAEPIAGNNASITELAITDAPNVDSVPFEAIILDPITPGGGVTITNGSGYRQFVDPAPTIPGNVIARFQWSGGTVYYQFMSSRPLPVIREASADEEVDLIAKFVADIHANQWAPPGSTPVPVVITTAGNSLSTKITEPGEPDREGAALYPISTRMVDLLNGYQGVPGARGSRVAGARPESLPPATRIPGVQFIDDNQSFGGKTLSNFTTQLGASTYYTSGQTDAVIINPGPNDWREGNYNTGQQFPPGFEVIVEIHLECVSRGIPLIIVLPADPDPTQNDHAEFFSDPENAAIVQNYPYFAAAPVDPENEQYPPASNSVGFADMTGHGVPIPFDRRFEHGAAAIRAYASRFPKSIILVDTRKASQRAVEALQPDAYTKGLLFAPGDAIHYLPYMHDRAGGFPAIDLAQDILAGGPIKPVYDGGEWRDFGPDA